MLESIHMEKRLLLAPYYILAAAFIGFGDTLYLSYYKFLGLVPTCAILHGCDQVLTSTYSTFYGVPLAYFGLVFYTYMIAFSLLLSLDPFSKGLRWGMMIYTSIGLLCSVLFETLQIVSIKALCIYCATSAFITLTLFLLSVWHIRSSRSNDAARL